VHSAISFYSGLSYHRASAPPSKRALHDRLGLHPLLIPATSKAHQTAHISPQRVQGGWLTWKVAGVVEVDSAAASGVFSWQKRTPSIKFCLDGEHSSGILPSLSSF
jgi:hypothetical protein